MIFFFAVLMSCQNSAQKTATTTTKVLNPKDSLSANTAESPCDTFAFKLNYNDYQERFRTIEFKEGNQVFRIVPDTTGHNFLAYVQKQVNENCWTTIEEEVQCRQNGLLLVHDYNSDGFQDLTNEWSRETHISLYNPKTQLFHTTTLGGSIDSINTKVIADYRSLDKKGNGEATLYKFVGYELQPLAVIKLFSKAREEENNGYEVDRMELYEIKGNNEKLIKGWHPQDIPQFIKNNGSYNYFEEWEFLQDYWQKNWQHFFERK